MEFNTKETKTPTTTPRPGLGTSTASGGNPASDPLTGAFVPGQTETLAVVGGTNAPDPIIGGTLGGLPDVFAIATGITSSVSSKMYEEALLRTLAFTSTTTRGTVLDTITYDPFSASCVNPAAALYASIHSQFTGSILLSIEAVGNATLTGRLGVAFLPSLYPETTQITPENLFLFDHSIIDISASGKATFEMKATTSSSFVVQKGDGKYYGKLVIIAYTDIANSYGTSMNIPLNVYSRLTPTSLYSGMDVTLFSSPALSDSKGYVPIFPDTRNATMITEAFEPVYADAFNGPTSEYIYRERTPGQNHNRWDDATTNGIRLSQYWGHIRRPSPKWINKVGEQTRYAEVPSVINEDSASVQIDPDFQEMIISGIVTTKINYDSPRYTTTLTRAFGDMLNTETDDLEVDLGDLTTGSYGSFSYNERGEPIEAHYYRTTGTTFAGDGSYTLRWGLRGTASENNDPTTYVPTDLICKSGRIISASRVCPLGYRALRLIDANWSVPAVKPGVVGETTYYGVEFLRFFGRAQTYFTANPTIKSLTYTVAYTNGDLVADVLVNKYGVWTAAEGVDDYGLFLGELSFTQSGVTRNTTEWVKLRPAKPTYWVSRTFEASGYRRVINEIVRNIQPQMMASIVGGMAIGAGTGLANIGERKFLRRMQDDRQAHAFAAIQSAAKAKNWLADQDYARKYAQQVAEVKTTQSRLMRPSFASEGNTQTYSAVPPPGTSQQAADASAANATLDQEVASRKALYGGLAGHPPTRKSLDHDWDQQKLLLDVRNRFEPGPDDLDQSTSPEPLPRTKFYRGTRPAKTPVPTPRTSRNTIDRSLETTESDEENEEEMAAHFDMQAAHAATFVESSHPVSASMRPDTYTLTKRYPPNVRESESSHPVSATMRPDTYTLTQRHPPNVRA